ncbi:MAG: ABC transporter substrate-binding protein [Candidatus Niyogibacteria bacterium]|nr:ABC transporter substrate-binding protein [Candidatus Niyogibacteria bacterium]
MKNKYILWISAVVILAAAGYWYWNENLKIIKTSRGTPRGAVTEMKYIIMKHFGIDRKNGLEMDFPVFDPGELERRFFSGEAGGLGGMSPLVASRSNLEGKNVRILYAELTMTYNLAVRKDSPILNLEDLKGRKVGVLPKTTAAYSSLELILNSAGMNPARDFKLVFGPIPEMVSLLRKGEVDAAIVSYPLAATLFAGEEFRSIADLEQTWENEEGLTHPTVVMVAFEDWLENRTNRKIAERFIKASNETARLIKERPEILTDEGIPGIKEFLEKNNIKTEEAKRLLRENAPKLIYSEWTDLETGSIERVLDRAKENNLIPANSPTDIIVKPGSL